MGGRCFLPLDAHFVPTWTAVDNICITDLVDSTRGPITVRPPTNSLFSCTYSLVYIGHFFLFNSCILQNVQRSAKKDVQRVCVKSIPLKRFFANSKKKREATNNFYSCLPFTYPSLSLCVCVCLCCKTSEEISVTQHLFDSFDFFFYVALMYFK